MASDEGGVPGKSSQSDEDEDEEEGDEVEVEFLAEGLVFVELDAFALATDFSSPQPPSLPAAADSASAPALESSSRLPEAASGAAGGRKETGVILLGERSTIAGASKEASSPLARFLPPPSARLDDSEPAAAFPSSLAAASSISPNRKFHRDDICLCVFCLCVFCLCVLDLRFGIREGTLRGRAIVSLGKNATRGKRQRLSFF